MSTLDEIKELNAFHLADMAGCMSPDDRDSEGALMLVRVRDSFIEKAESGEVKPGDPGDAAHEIADGAPSIYTHTRWQEFVDLGAYQEEPECGEWPDDLTDTAAVALYQIADRLVHALANELDEEEEGAE